MIFSWCSFLAFVISYAVLSADFRRAVGKSHKNYARRIAALSLQAYSLVRAQKAAALMTATLALLLGSSIIPNDICRSRAFLRVWNISLCTHVVYNDMLSAVGRTKKQRMNTRDLPTF